ncbi:glycosyltransferase family 39 protein [Streptomyces sp. PTM05]|uniref:Glycosyltransferase family 39 protein n=1 Tax=Streptantibioticus parmotrematis TaxID=2873249 RepID=A0ABS7QUG5_9ACTN|nr:glycosyltransferase family 39 protein [Streptantibioticus parmotrematis]MBY8886853.1 glycosyltransferase family 39 protein [Streptantibioticus parmotrematis]
MTALTHPFAAPARAESAGAADRPRWERPAFLGLLAATALLYLVDLSSSGWANSFYSAAVQAGSRSWKAFFFGSSDAANFITVDKPPASLWPMELSVRLFGLNSWAILVPQALMGVATVAVLYAAVRRRFGAAAGLIAGGVLALTPVATLMFRFNNPDAMLALLLVCAIYATQRALEAGRTKWLVAAGALIGFAFLVKTLQAFLVLPALALVYAFLAPVRVRRRVWQLALATAALVVAGGWWVAIVQLTPAADRPYVGGSQHNSFLELTFGYNGFGRLDGSETGSVGGGGTGGGAGPGGGKGFSMWGSTGITRLFGSDMGGQISWLLPAALILLVAGVVLTWRAKRTDTERQAFLLWGGALLTTAAVFSYMAGIFHPYYNIALAPYIGAVVGMGAVTLWRRRSSPWAAGTLALAVAVSAWWAFELLGRTPDWLPWLRWAVLLLGLAAALGLAFTGRIAMRVLTVTAVTGGLVAALAGPAAYAVDTVSTGHTGSLPSAGPAQMGGMGFPGGGARGAHGGKGGAGGFGGFPGGGGTGKAPGGTGTAVRGGMPGGFPGGGTGGFPGAGGGQGGKAPSGGGALSGKGGKGGKGQMGGMGGAMGGLLDGTKVSSAVKSALSKDASSYTWVAATVGSQNQASYQLATQDPVMAIGGFNGSDPAPTLAEFEKMVSEHKIHYFIAGGMGSGGTEGAKSTGGTGAFGQAMGVTTDTPSQITAWVEAHYTAKKVGDTTLYDLTAPRAS